MGLRIFFMCFVGALNVGSINLYFDEKLKTNQFWAPKNLFDYNNYSLDSKDDPKQLSNLFKR